ncbi:unnamed protein product [Soboliphyme baturini]|uniref:Ig-like domain-containing protein n=1 Tax=Soboliphyme baturini TaxID=241478 RepID=A0A183J0K1_9BILA|nr:unnamed protein product [Soboliphyme baturini]
MQIGRQTVAAQRNSDGTSKGSNQLSIGADLSLKFPAVRTGHAGVYWCVVKLFNRPAYNPGCASPSLSSLRLTHRKPDGVPPERNTSFLAITATRRRISDKETVVHVIGRLPRIQRLSLAEIVTKLFLYTVNDQLDNWRPGLGLEVGRSVGHLGEGDPGVGPCPLSRCVFHVRRSLSLFTADVNLVSCSKSSSPVTGLPHLVTVPSRDVFKMLNDSLELLCDAVGTPTPSIQWLKTVLSFEDDQKNTDHLAHVGRNSAADVFCSKHSARDSGSGGKPRSEVTRGGQMAAVAVSSCSRGADRRTLIITVPTTCGFTAGTRHRQEAINKAQACLTAALQVRQRR